MNPDSVASRPRRVFVVGAGIAGLSCAWELHKRGFEVSVLEANATPGGRCREVEIDGLRVRSGARMLYSFYRGVMGLIDELGLHEDIVRIGHASIRCESDGPAYPLTFGPSRQLLFGGAVPLGEVLKLPRLLPDLLKARLQGDPDDWLSMPDADGQSLASYLGEKGLARFNERVVSPLFRGARNWNPDEVSAGFFLLTTAFMSGHYAFTFRQGIGHLAQKLAERLDVRYQTRVASIESTQGGMRVIGSRQTPEGLVSFDEQVDLVVCAVEGNRAAELLREPPAPAAEFLDQVRYNPLTVDYAELAESGHASLAFHAAGHVSGLSILERVSATGGPGGAPRLFCQASPERSRKPGELAGDQPELEAFVQAQLPGIEIKRWVRQRIESMLPLPYPGYLSALRRFRDAQASRPGRLYFAGDYLSMALVGGACASGQRTAQDILSHWSSAASSQ